MKILIFILFVVTLSQQPCGTYQFDEDGCISSTYEKCLWNSFLSSCQSTESTNIGCSSTLNRLACINQLKYPNNVWAYCRFSGYCRDITTTITDCSTQLSQPACLAAIGVSCYWQNVCLPMSDTQLQIAIQNAQNDMSFLYQSNIYVCQSISKIPIVHQWSAFTYIQQLIRQYSTETTLQTKYMNMLDILGCLQVDSALLGLLPCTAPGLNSVACSSITTSGQLCIFQNKACKTITDTSTLNCSDIINKAACLAVTNIKQPCYWSDGCKLYLAKNVQCNVAVSQVSPSFCSAINYIYQDDNEKPVYQECFYISKKNKCSELCKSQSLMTTQKSCNQSSFGCVYSQTQSSCLFSNVSSQCGITGQNKLSCMKANESCQYLNGQCKSIPNSSLSTLKCTDGLNLQACIHVTKTGQLCIIDDKSKECIAYHDYYYCSELKNVNENVCRKQTDDSCFWSNGNCTYGNSTLACTTKGLNKIGCLAITSYACQWIVESGICQDAVIIVNETQCEQLKEVNEVACRHVLITDQLCKYDANKQACVTFSKEDPNSQTFEITCSTKGLNKYGCLSVADSTIACQWSNNQCKSLNSSSNLNCLNLINVTSKACSFVKSEPCQYDTNQQRCTTSVIKKPDACDTLVLNGKGCAFIQPINNGKCYFDSVKLKCLGATDTQTLSSLYCVASYPNKLACLSITSPGQLCQWNQYKNLCETFKVPTYQECTNISQVNNNTCLGFYSDVDYYIDETCYCTISQSNINSCQQFDTNTDNTNCFKQAQQQPNLHACVALTDGQNCYFDQNQFKCTTLLEDDQKLELLSQLLCQQVNSVLCTQITTVDQNCAWDQYQKKCFSVDQCYEAWDQNDCKKVKQPCVYHWGECVLVLTTNSYYFECTEAMNKQACLAIRGQACEFTQDNECVQLKQNLDQDDCNSYTGKIVNPITCAQLQIGYCVYDTQLLTCKYAKGNQDFCKTCQDDTCSPCYSDYVICQFGQNSNNCSYKTSCSFDYSKYTCTVVESQCTTVSSLDQCAQLNDYCQWDGNGCKLAKFYHSCQSYIRDHIQVTQDTCHSAFGSDEDKTLCIQDDSENNKYYCIDTIPYKCELAYYRVDCYIVRNDCIWTTNYTCVLRIGTSQSCSDFFTRWACLKMYDLYCQWNKIDDYESECIVDNTSSVPCLKDPSDKITEVKPIYSARSCYYDSCYFDDNSLKCIKMRDEPQQECYQALSPKECQLVDESKNCYWDIDKVCKELTDFINAGPLLTFRQVKYSHQKLCLLPTSEGELTEWWNGKCYIIDTNASLCTDIINLRACQAILNDDPIQQCIYQLDSLTQTKTCQIANLTLAKCLDVVNLYTCVGITTQGQYCVWLGQECTDVLDDGYTYTKYSTVNQNACLKTYTLNGQISSLITDQIGVKFSVDRCVLSDPENDTCDTPGLNYFGCLQTKAGQCNWNGSNCVTFNASQNRTKCSDYQKVSAGVCISIDQLSCTWKNYNCADSTTTMNCTDSLSKQACVSQISNSCKWENNKCQNQVIIDGYTTCLNVSQFSSIKSCQLISAEGQPCLHNGTGCTISLDIKTAKCRTPGLNAIACTQITLQNCIFQDNQCQVYTGTSQECRSLSNVSPNICSQISDSTQPCKFSAVNNKCVIVYTYDLCTTKGINSVGCNSLQLCTWNKDQEYCGCASELNSTSFCADQSISTCTSLSKCIIDQSKQKCRAKVCSDLNSTLCTGNSLNSSYCYLTSGKICSSAKTCDDVKDVSDCTKITINGQQCYTHLNNICKSKECSDNLSDTLCTGLCEWDGTQCNDKLCQIITQKNKCYGTYSDGSCYWINGLCTGFTSCYQVLSISDDTTILENTCNSMTINGSQCNWQKSNQYSSDYECSSNLCRPFGSSKLSCYGAEIGGYVCIITIDSQCLRCEDITDQCYCTSQVGDCQYLNNKCKSIPCSSYDQTSCVLYSRKCMWNTKTNTCQVTCSKLRQTECQKMQSDTSSCYWNSQLNSCNSGVQEDLIIDTVSVQLANANINITVNSSLVVKLVISTIIFILY